MDGEYLLGQLSKLPNIGKVVEEQLIQIGISTPDELINIGSKEAWLRIQRIDASACINRLMALEGAIQNVNKPMLSDDTKKDLKEFYQAHKI